MNPVTQLLYSYVRTAIRLEQTNDLSFKKTLGMFRMRLKNQGIIVKSYAIEEDTIILQLEVNGEPKHERLQKPDNF